MGAAGRPLGPARFRRPARGRADLLYYRAREGHEALARSAPLLGYQAPQPEPPVERGVDEPGLAGETAGALRDTPPAPERPKGMRFIRLRERRPVPAEQRATEVPERLRQAQPFLGPDLGDPEYVPPPMPPLAPWSRLWPFLRAALGTEQFSHRLDLPRLVDGLARGHSFRRLPRLPRAGWSPAAQLILDLDLRLYPFWEDAYRLVEQLHGLRGRAGLQVVCFEDGPDGVCRAYRSDGPDRPCLYHLPEAGTPLLVLSDLGLLDARTDPWLAFGRRLKAAGLRPVALLPCPERYWDAQLTELYFPVVWDRAWRLPRRLGGPRPRPDGGAGPAVTPDPGGEPGVARLLRLLAWAVRVEPALLRAVRHLLPAREADVGSEAAVWRHPDVRDDGVTWVLRPERQEAYRDALVEEDAALRARAVALMRRQHQGLSPAIRHEEEIIRAHGAGDEPDAEALDFLWDAAATLFREPPEYGYASHLKAWVLRLAARQHQAVWSWKHADPMAAALARVLHEHHRDDPDISFPAGFDVNRVLWAVPHADRPREYRLVQEQRTLKLETSSDHPHASGNFETAGALVVASLRMVTTRLQWQLQVAGRRVGPVHLMDIRRDREIPVPEAGRLLVQGNFENLEIDGLERPDWARIQQGSGRLELQPLEDPGRSLCWFRPGEYEVKDRTGRVIGSYGIRQGFFLDREEFDGLTAEGFRQPDWADAVGLDGYGLWAEVRYQGAAQRFRWIPPGEFLMGSPEDETERGDDETRHPVMLTRSLWLADSACTQALWQAVMGDNPSRFQGADRPVENISWDQAQAFVERLNGERSDLELRLPSEAEWEYACRASTQTPFWFGETVTTEQANYDGNYPYAGGEKGEYRGETVAVRALPANAWGLYQMHGNVWEWCQDWYGEYPGGSVRDPRGPETGAWRVLRGGGWGYDARWLRSAARFLRPPGIRYVFTGFRLARGRTGRQVSKGGQG